LKLKTKNKTNRKKILANERKPAEGKDVEKDITCKRKI